MSDWQKWWCVAGIVCAVAGVCGGQTSAPASADAWAVGELTPEAVPLTITGYWENDSTILKRNHPTDRHYTNGLALSIAGQPQWADDLADRAPFADAFGPARTAAGLIVGQLMFTPEDLNANGLMEDDRPYAGYLFAGVYWQRANATTFDHVQLDLGLVGPSSLAEDAQEFAHDVFGETEPNGWDEQLSDEPTIQLYLRRKWKLPLGPQEAARPAAEFGDPTLRAELIPQAGLALGTVYRYVEAGATARVGFNLPDDFGPGRLADVAAATALPRTGWHGYGFARATGRLVEHNMFLEGNNFTSSHGVDPEPAVAEVQVGLALGYRAEHWILAANYSQTYQTREFKDQSTGDAFGALSVSLTGWF